MDFFLSCRVETDARKCYWQINNKNPQFLPNQGEIQAILPTHELVITHFDKVSQ